MASETTSNQPWHVPEPSPWPIVGTGGALASAVGLIWYMHSNVLWLLIVGLMIVAYTMFGWWREVLKESSDGRSHSSPVKIGLRYSVLLFIASEVMFFSLSFGRTSIRVYLF